MPGTASCSLVFVVIRVPSQAAACDSNVAILEYCQRLIHPLMTIICFVYRKLDENYYYIRVLSKIILCPILIHCNQVSVSEMSCSRRFLFKLCNKNTLVDTFVEKASERLKMNFFLHSRLSKLELKWVRNKITSKMHSF